MAELSTLLNEPTRGALVSDLTELAEKTVSEQSGLTGMAIKSAVAGAKRTNSDALSKGINQILPKLIDELEPYWASYQEDSTTDFGTYLADNEDDVVASVLSVGDSVSDKAPGPVKKVYEGLRGKAGKIIAPALPEFGAIVEKHAK